MQFLKQSTAATIKLGPFVDDGDGKTAETGLTISQADIRLSKNGGDFAQTNNATGATHDEFGYYDIPLDTTDTGTLGRLRVAVSESGALPVWQDFVVVTANVYDTLCSTDTFDVNVTTIATDAITAASLKADAAAEIASAAAISVWEYELFGNVSSGMAGYDLLNVLSHLTDIKGAGWTNETLVTLKAYVDEIETRLTAARAGYLDKLNVTGTLAHSDAAATYKADVSGLAPANEYDARMTAIQADLDNPDQYKADVSALATTAHVQEVEDKVDIVDGIADAILEDTGTTIPATLGTMGTQLDGYDNQILPGGDLYLEIEGIKAKTDQLTFTVANKVDATATTDTSSIAGDVWSYAKRTLTHPSVSAEVPEDSNTLILYRDADIAIELTDLTIPAGAKKYIFTIKDNLDSGDDQAVLQASYAIDGSEVETNTLVYINSAEAPALTNPVTFTLTETNISIDLTAEAAALLPRYERGYLNWDLKLVTDAAVTIVLQGFAQIIGTSTRAIQ